MCEQTSKSFCVSFFSGVRIKMVAPGSFTSVHRYPLHLNCSNINRLHEAWFSLGSLNIRVILKSNVSCLLHIWRAFCNYWLQTRLAQILCASHNARMITKDNQLPLLPETGVFLLVSGNCFEFQIDRELLMAKTINWWLILIRLIFGMFFITLPV